MRNLLVPLCLAAGLCACGASAAWRQPGSSCQPSECPVPMLPPPGSCPVSIDCVVQGDGHCGLRIAWCDDSDPATLDVCHQGQGDAPDTCAHLRAGDKCDGCAPMPLSPADREERTGEQWCRPWSECRVVAAAGASATCAAVTHGWELCRPSRSSPLQHVWCDQAAHECREGCQPSSAHANCPRPPCQDARCPAVPGALCVADPCGHCTPRFFLGTGPAATEVTHLCPQPGDACSGCQLPQLAANPEPREGWCEAWAQCEVDNNWRCRARVHEAVDCNDSDPLTLDVCSNHQCVYALRS
eukprot:m51a1_g11974 hypothetical protein (299) ;mRNA; r:838454-839350